MPQDEGPESILPSEPDLIDSARQPELRLMLALTREAFDVPVALLVLADRQTTWLETSGGADHGSILSDGAIRDLALATRQLLIVGDVALDARFAGMRLGSGGPPIRFYAGMPIASGPDAQVGTLCLLDAKPRCLQAQQEQRLAEMAGIMAALLRGSGHARTVDPADAPPEKARPAGEHPASVIRYKKMYDRSSALAKIGVWECDLANDDLTWTDGVYDLFELPRGSAVTRTSIVDLYFKSSRIEMERLRLKAIQERGSFSLDVRIRTARGNKRWLRLSADVECENGLPARLFGLKQDITQEKELWDRMRLLAERDPLTGLANRGVFEVRLLRSLASKPTIRALAALVLIDLDGFKEVNDTFGHAAGDECLKQIADRIRGIFKRAGLVARIGGDEFAVLMCGSVDRMKIERDVRRAIGEIGLPVIWNGRSFDVGASIGIAIPDDQDVYTSTRIFAEADSALYAAKRAGRNTFRIFNSETTQKPDPWCSPVRRTALASA